jgi:hypothetical protein
MATAITTTNVDKAKAELARMRRSLSAWLKYRTLNDQVLSGALATKKPTAYAQMVIQQNRDYAAEQRLANQLHVLLENTMPDAQLPNPDLNGNANAAVQLAQLAINGSAPTSSAPQSVGALAPWFWPVLIVGALLLGVTIAISNAADVAKEKEHYACIEAGACTDYGFWLKAGGVVALAWFAWEKWGKHYVKGGR